jgi:hypothetical protein
MHPIYKYFYTSVVYRTILTVSGSPEFAWQFLVNFMHIYLSVICILIAFSLKMNLVTNIYTISETGITSKVLVFCLNLTTMNRATLLVVEIYVQVFTRSILRVSL